jgi:hypothetical protein
MNTKKLLNDLEGFFDMTKKKRSKHAKELKALIKKLKDKEKKLIAKCDKEKDKAKCDVIDMQIAFLHAKRKKGLSSLKKLNRNNK